MRKIQKTLMTIGVLVILPLLLAGFKPLASQQPTILPPEQAFNLFVQLTQDSQLVAYWNIAPNHYLYRDKISVTSSQTKTSPTFPKSESILDPALGQQEIYRSELKLPISLFPSSHTSIFLTVSYQDAATPVFVMRLSTHILRCY